MNFKIGDSEFIKTKMDGLDGKTMVAWAESDSDFEIRVNQTGVWYQGTMKLRLDSMPFLQKWAELTSEAWKEFKRLSPKISLTPQDREVSL